MNPAIYSLKNKQKVLSALDALGFLISDADRDKYVNNFISELKDALLGKKASLQVLPSFVKFSSKVSCKDKIAVLEAGKSTFSKGYFNVDEKCRVYGVMGYPMPGLGKEISLDEFFRKIIFDARDVLRVCDRIGFCFDHAIEVNAKGDGKLLGWSRGEINVPELIERYIGEEFKKFLSEEFEKNYKIILLNDTVSTLIAGLVETNEKEFEDFIGLVHSTGYNLSYIEEGKNIARLVDNKKYLNSQMVLNTQAGSFSKVKESEVDESVKVHFKEIAMGEFSQKVNSECLPVGLRVIVEKLSGKVLDPKVSKRITEMSECDLEQIYSFLRAGLKSSLQLSSLFRHATLEDAASLGVIIDRLFQRAARLVAIQISGILKYKNIGHNPIQPVGIIVNGEFFEIVKDFEIRVRCEIAKYFGNSDPRYIKFLYVPNATLLGAGIAAAINL